MQKQFDHLLGLLPEGANISRVNNWHKANRWVYDLCRTPTILDYVQDLLGPNFFQWGGHFFCKFPRDGKAVPYHQDTHYWPLNPQDTVSVWLAFFDAGEENGCLQVVPGSHRWGDLQHETRTEEKYMHGVQDQLVVERFNPENLINLDLKAGEISLFDDDLIHGSTANHSDKMRVGLAMRFCPFHVKCDLNVWPTFEAYPARGTDEFHYNPEGHIPEGDKCPTEMFQASTEFV